MLEHLERQVSLTTNQYKIFAAALIGDMLDFARGRLGGGFSLNRDPACP